MSKLKEFLEKENIPHKNDVILSHHTYCKVGGKCEFILTPNDKCQMSKVIVFLNENKIKFTIIGETSNMLFLDDVVYGVIISTKLMDSISISGNVVSVGAGANLSNFLRLLYSRNVIGFEGLEGIPGTVGGAVFMNAGAYGYETSTYINRVECIDKQGEIVFLTKEDCEFSQRDSIFRKEREYLIIAVEFAFEYGKEHFRGSAIERLHIARHSYQEFVFPNTGSVFTAKECVYEELCNTDKRYKIAYKLLVKVFHNKLMRMINRKAPSRRVINDFTIRYFGLSSVSKCISKKHINMFSNNGVDSWYLLEYIIKMKKILGDKVKLENEIITDSIVQEDEFGKYRKYKKSISKAIE